MDDCTLSGLRFCGKGESVYFCAGNRKLFLRWPTRDMLQIKRNVANKKETLQTKKKRCKQKRNAANKKETLQTKKKRCKRKGNAANKIETLQTNKKKIAANKKKGTAASIKKGTLQIKKRTRTVP